MTNHERQMNYNDWNGVKGIKLNNQTRVNGILQQYFVHIFDECNIIIVESGLTANQISVCVRNDTTMSEWIP